jgi:hypothetical protein
MKRLKAGAVLLSIWCGLNLAVAAAVTAMTLAGRNAPALSLLLTDAQIRSLNPKAVAVVNAQAALANPCIIALCVLVLVVVWTSLVARARWALRALAATLIPLQAFGYVSDAYLGHRNFAANVTSTIILVSGLVLAGLGMRARDGSGRVAA